MSRLEASCPACGRTNAVRDVVGFQRVDCQCGVPIFAFVSSDGRPEGLLTCQVLKFDINEFSAYLKRANKKVDTFNLKTGLFYSGCDRAYVYPTGQVDAMPVARAKLYRWIQEYLTANPK